MAVQPDPVLVHSAPPPGGTDAPGAAIEAVGLVRRFGPVAALDGVSLEVRRGEFFSLLGPSGCGKTTLLRLIAGLDHPDAGSLRIAGRDALPVPAHRRPVNTVFQSYALFPHLTVAANVAFGLRMAGRPAPDIERRARGAMELTQIAGLADRMPAQLSGGQKQRVALARALVNEPEVLLLDEPLGALDLQLRQQLQGELRALQRRLGITFIHVTHDQGEALAMSDRLAVMQAGRIAQLGEPAAVYDRPRTRFVAEFLGACNLIAGHWSDGGPTATGERLVQTELGPLACAAPDASPANAGQVTLSIRPEKVRLLAPSEPAPANTVPAVVEASTYLGADTQFRVRAGEFALTASRVNGSGGPVWRAGDAVRAVMPADALVVLED